MITSTITSPPSVLYGGGELRTTYCLSIYIFIKYTIHILRLYIKVMQKLYAIFKYLVHFAGIRWIRSILQGSGRFGPFCRDPVDPVHFAGIRWIRSNLQGSGKSGPFSRDPVDPVHFAGIR